MEQLLKALRKGYTITLHSEFDAVEITVQDRKDNYAKKTVYEREIETANFDAIHYSVDECIRLIEDM